MGEIVDKSDIDIMARISIAFILGYTTVSIFSEKFLPSIQFKFSRYD